MRRTKLQKGFTLIELLIVIGIIAILAAILIPNLLKSRKGANEKAVVSTMKGVSSAQATFYMEKDGQFAYLDELESGGYLGLGVKNKTLDGAGKINGFEKNNYKWTYSLGNPPSEYIHL